MTTFILYTPYVDCIQNKEKLLKLYKCSISLFQETHLPENAKVSLKIESNF